MWKHYPAVQTCFSFQEMKLWESVDNFLSESEAFLYRFNFNIYIE